MYNKQIRLGFRSYHQGFTRKVKVFSRHSQAEGLFRVERTEKNILFFTFIVPAVFDRSIPSWLQVLEISGWHSKIICTQVILKNGEMAGAAACTVTVRFFERCLSYVLLFFFVVVAYLFVFFSFFFFSVTYSLLFFSVVFFPTYSFFFFLFFFIIFSSSCSFSCSNYISPVGFPSCPQSSSSSPFSSLFLLLHPLPLLLLLLLLFLLSPGEIQPVSLLAPNSPHF